MLRQIIFGGIVWGFLTACSEASDPNIDEGVDAVLFVRAHDDKSGFRLDQELELSSGDRIILEHADAGLAGTLFSPHGEPIDLKLGTHDVRVYGERQTDRFVATRVESRAVDDEKIQKKSQPLLNVFGQRDTLLLLIGFPGAPNTYDPAAMREGIFGDGVTTNGLYREASRGTMWLGGIKDPNGDVWGPYEVPTNGCSTMTYSEVSDLALAAAEKDGIDVDAYDHRIYSFPAVDSCPGGGIGGGSQVWVFGIGPSAIWDWVGHEAAHGFGFLHASSFDNCTIASDPVTMGGACTHNEYGDPTDIMGRRNFQFSSWHLERAGWLEPKNVAVVNESERIRIAPLTLESDQIQSLRVPRDGGDFFHFEYRAPVGFDAALEPELTDGVLVRIVADPNNEARTHLLDMTPATLDNTDAALATGRSFQDGNMLVTVVETTGDEAVLDVIIDGVPPKIGAGGTVNEGTGGSASDGIGGSSSAAGGLPESGGNGSGGAATGGANSGGTGTGADGYVSPSGGSNEAPGATSGNAGGCGCRSSPQPANPFGALLTLGLGIYGWMRSRSRDSAI